MFRALGLGSKVQEVGFSFDRALVLAGGDLSSHVGLGCFGRKTTPLSLSLYVYMHVYIYIYITCIYIYIYICIYIYIYICYPPPSVIYLFRGFPGHAGEHVPKTRGHVQFLIRARVYRLWHCAVRIVFI